MLADDFLHFRGFGQTAFGFLVLTALFRDGSKFLPDHYKQACDEDRFGNLAVLVRRGLERLARRVREAVEIQAVVPVGSTDERQAVRTDTFEGVIETAAQVFVKRLLGARFVFELHRFVEDAPVAGFLEVGRDAQDEPVRIVVEAAADVVVPAFGERLILVERAAGLELRGRDVEDAFAGAGRDHLDKAQQVLVRITETQTPADAGFVERRRARHVERGHALVGVPDVDHAVGVDVGRLHVINAEQAVPIFPQRLEGGGDVFAFEIFRNDRFDGFFVDGLGVRRVEFFVHRIFVVAEDKDDFLRFAGLQIHFDVMRTVRRPAVRNRVEGFATLHCRRIVPTAVGAEERVALRIETGELFRAGEIREVVAALAILGLVVDDTVHDFDLAGAEIALEVGGVILGVPQAELDAGKNGELRRLFAAIRHLELPDLQRLAERHEIAGPRVDLVVTGTDDGVAHAVAAFVIVQLGPRGLPGRRPELPRVVVPDVEIAPAEIKRRVVVAVARQPAQARIAVKGIPAGGVGDDAEVGFTTQIVDPRQRGVGPGDDVFATLVVKVSVTHGCFF